ncbi:MAG TPA: hypothetical protein VIN10_03485, partial [Bacteroidales bacterium]
MKKIIFKISAIAMSIALMGVANSCKQPETAKQESKPVVEETKYKMTTEIPAGIAVPDKIESSIGTLNLNYGYPEEETVKKIYDNLDRSRALQAYLLGFPIVNQAGMRATLNEFGPSNYTDVIWEDLVDSKTVELTANDNTIYSFIW